jgi:hypothetical protein
MHFLLCLNGFLMCTKNMKNGIHMESKRSTVAPAEHFFAGIEKVNVIEK